MGQLEFSEISSAAGRDWTDGGEVHEASQPKGGSHNAIRRVPVPPLLVTMIREHAQEHRNPSMLSEPLLFAAHGQCQRCLRLMPNSLSTPAISALSCSCTKAMSSAGSSGRSPPSGL